MSSGKGKKGGRDARTELARGSSLRCLRGDTGAMDAADIVLLNDIWGDATAIGDTEQEVGREEEEEEERKKEIITVIK